MIPLCPFTRVACIIMYHLVLLSGPFDLLWYDYLIPWNTYFGVSTRTDQTEFFPNICLSMFPPLTLLWLLFLTAVQALRREENEELHPKFLETKIFFLTGNSIKYFAFCLVTFILYNIMSLIVSNFPLSANSFAPASMGIPIVVTKFEGPFCVTLRSFTSII